MPQQGTDGDAFLMYVLVVIPLLLRGDFCMALFGPADERNWKPIRAIVEDIGSLNRACLIYLLSDRHSEYRDDDLSWGYYSCRTYR